MACVVVEGVLRVATRRQLLLTTTEYTVLYESWILLRIGNTSRSTSSSYYRYCQTRLQSIRSRNVQVMWLLLSPPKVLFSGPFFMVDVDHALHLVKVDRSR